MRNPWGFVGSHVRARIMRVRAYACALVRARERAYTHAREYILRLA